MTEAGHAGPGSQAREFWNVEGYWQDAVTGALLNRRLYTTHASGHLRVLTGLHTEAMGTRFLAEGFGETEYLLTDGEALLTIESTGNLYRVNPDDGTKTRIGEKGGWTGTIAASILNGELYTVDTEGALYVSDLETGEWTQLGRKEFANTAFLLGAGDWLYSIENTGNLYRIDPENGHWRTIGQDDWKHARCATVYEDLLYTYEGHEGIYSTEPDAVSRLHLIKPRFEVRLMLPGTAGKYGGLYLIDAQGTIHHLPIPPEE